MQNKALIIIDIQNDITKNYKSVIDYINTAISWAKDNDMHVIYIRHENLSLGTRTFKHNTLGAELVSDMNIVSDNIFTKYKGNLLTSEKFVEYIQKNEINDFYIAGADAMACVKSSCYNMAKAGFNVTVLADCITSWNTKIIPDMLDYYKKKGSKIININDLK